MTKAWTIAFLLFLFMLINFADKIILGLAGPQITADLKLSPQQFGQLGAAFFYCFSLSAIAVGLVADRVPTRRILVLLALSWSVVQLPMIWDADFDTLYVCRILLGLGEGPAFAMALHALYQWFPDEKRALPTAVLAQGSAFGVIAAAPALNWLIVHYSWHSAFAALGIAGFVWCAVWLVLGKEGPLAAGDRHAAQGSTGWAGVVLSRTFLGACIASFGAYWAVSIALTWHTLFLVGGLGLPQSVAGIATAAPWALGAVFMLITGWWSGHLLKNGATRGLARGALGSVPLLVAGCMLLALPLAETPTAKAVLLTVAISLCGAIFVTCSPAIAEIAGDRR